MDPKRPPGIQFGQIFLKDAHFSHREDALGLAPNTEVGELPVSIQVQVMGKAGEKVAAVTVRAATPDKSNLLYSFSVEMAAIVNTVPGQENMDPLEYARNMGPAALFPFLREAVANLSVRGRFGPIYLKPFNFQAAQIQLTPGPANSLSTVAAASVGTSAREAGKDGSKKKAKRRK